MRNVWLLIAVIYLLIGSAIANPGNLDPGVFNTKANFSVDQTAMALSSAVATIEPRTGAPGYSWVRIHFYSFPLTAEDVTGAMNGDVSSMDKKWIKLASNPPEYNKGNAVLQLSVDKDFKVWQADMSVPGHTCTIAPFEPDVKAFLQSYEFDGKHLKLKSKGSYVCDMAFMKIPNQKFGWDVNLDIPVFEKVRTKK
jgi:hypothetical protein